MKNLILVIMCFILYACSNSNKDTGDGLFKIYIFDGRSLDKLIEFDQNINNIIATIPLDQADYIISDIDILEYDWDSQIFKIQNEFNNEIPGYFLIGGYFVVEFKGQRLFGGRTTTDFSAMSISEPVLMYMHDSYAADRQFNIFAFRRYGSIAVPEPYEFLAQDATVNEQVKDYFANAHPLNQ